MILRIYGFMTFACGGRSFPRIPLYIYISTLRPSGVKCMVLHTASKSCFECILTLTRADDVSRMIDDGRKQTDARKLERRKHFYDFTILRIYDFGVRCGGLSRAEQYISKSGQNIKKGRVGFPTAASCCACLYLGARDKVPRTTSDRPAKRPTRGSRKGWKFYDFANL